MLVPKVWNRLKREDLIKVSNEKIAEAIMNNREGKIKIKPGYDGVYGEPVFENNEKPENNQKGLNRFL